MTAATRLSQIVLVHDLAERKPSLDLANALGLRPVSLPGLSPASLLQASGLVVNIDLADLANVRRLRVALSALKRSLPVAMFVESGVRTHASTTQAQALGATTLLRRPLSVEQLRTALIELGLHAPTKAASGEVSIRAAAKVLDNAFRSLHSGTPLDVNQAAEASRQLLTGVASAGLSTWLQTVRSHHDGTFQHCLLVTGAAAAYGSYVRLSEPDQLTLTTAALLHDIGKAEIPLEILDKPGALTAAESTVIKGHPAIGAGYLAQQPGFAPCIVQAVAAHHEYLDGSGYPFGLSAEQIDPLTRVLTVCDIYGALIERRSYKPPKSSDDAMLILHDMVVAGKLDSSVTQNLRAALVSDGLGV